MSTGVIFSSDRLCPRRFARLEPEFYSWLLTNVGRGEPSPVKSLDHEPPEGDAWVWVDDRINDYDALWRRHGIKIAFKDPRSAMLAKLTWCL